MHYNHLFAVKSALKMPTKKIPLTQQKIKARKLRSAFLKKM